MPDHYFAMPALVRAEATRRTADQPPRTPRPATAPPPAPQVTTSPAQAAHSPAAARPNTLRSALTGAVRALRTVFG